MEKLNSCGVPGFKNTDFGSPDGLFTVGLQLLFPPKIIVCNAPCIFLTRFQIAQVFLIDDLLAGQQPTTADHNNYNAHPETVHQI
jgi:hypothetical protein